MFPVTIRIWDLLLCALSRLVLKKYYVLAETTDCTVRYLQVTVCKLKHDVMSEMKLADKSVGLLKASESCSRVENFFFLHIVLIY